MNSSVIVCKRMTMIHWRVRVRENNWIERGCGVSWGKRTWDIWFTPHSGGFSYALFDPECKESGFLIHIKKRKENKDPPPIWWYSKFAASKTIMLDPELWRLRAEIILSNLIRNLRIRWRHPYTIWADKRAFRDTVTLSS